MVNHTREDDRRRWRDRGCALQSVVYHLAQDPMWTMTRAYIPLRYPYFTLRHIEALRQ